MTIELYHSAYSTCSQKVRLVLHEKGLDFISHEISFRKEEQLTPEYLKINPNGVVPTLVHNGQPIMDSSCIIEYLDEVFPECSLSPESPLDRARMRAWLRFIEEVPTSAVRIPSFEKVFLPALRLVKSKKGFEKSIDKRTIRTGFYKKMNDGKGFEQSVLQDSVRQLLETVKRLNTALEQGDWILGEKLSLADMCLVPLIDRVVDLKMQYLWHQYPAVQDWYERMTDRESFQKAFYKGSRLSQRLEFKLAFATMKKTQGKFEAVLESV
ncbi:glutathione S-transferase family protein [Maricurvus nonylphenolicus]|uniref:glutathione S-transferase family protein n=1 Tax=Maricurvus nonylphenolicus TaxID=1008307 RepID=UPI0036F22769